LFRVCVFILCVSQLLCSALAQRDCLLFTAAKTSVDIGNSFEMLVRKLHLGIRNRSPYAVSQFYILPRGSTTKVVQSSSIAIAAWLLFKTVCMVFHRNNFKIFSVNKIHSLYSWLNFRKVIQSLCSDFEIITTRKSPAALDL
jgi:hypothetical protein